MNRAIPKDDERTIRDTASATMGASGLAGERSAEKAQFLREKQTHGDPMAYAKGERPLGECGECKRLEIERKASIEQDEVAIREAHHRVKNNLATLASMLSITLARAKAPEAIEELGRVRDRIHSMTRLYDFIHASGPSRASIDIGKYLESVMASLAATYEDSKARLVLSLEAISIDLKRASALGLVAMELASDAVRYAYPEGSGEVRVSLSATADSISLVVEDDGLGAGSARRHLAGDGVGRLLCQALAQDLEASLTITVERGTRCALVFPK